MVKRLIQVALTVLAARDARLLVDRVGKGGIAKLGSITVLVPCAPTSGHVRQTSGVRSVARRGIQRCP